MCIKYSLPPILTKPLLFQKITLRVQPVLQSNHLYDYPHYEEREHMQHGERSPLLAGAMWETLSPCVWYQTLQSHSVDCFTNLSVSRETIHVQEKLLYAVSFMHYSENIERESSYVQTFLHKPSQYSITLLIVSFFF